MCSITRVPVSLPVRRKIPRAILHRATACTISAVSSVCLFHAARVATQKKTRTILRRRNTACTISKHVPRIYIYSINSGYPDFRKRHAERNRPTRPYPAYMKAIYFPRRIIEKATKLREVSWACTTPRLSRGIHCNCCWRPNPLWKVGHFFGLILLEARV